MTTEKNPTGPQRTPDQADNDTKLTPRQQQQLDEKRDAEARQRQQNEGGKQQG